MAGKNGKKKQETECVEANVLNARQRAFCEEYVINGHNGVKAALAAGYNGNERSLATAASRLLKRNDIREYLNILERPLKERREGEVRATAEEVLEFFSRVMNDPRFPPIVRVEAAKQLAKRYGLDRAEAREDEETREKLNAICEAFDRAAEKKDDDEH